MANGSIIDVIWATGRDFVVDWESSWISELLGDVPFKIRNLQTYDDISNNAPLIVVNHNIDYIRYLAQYETQRLPFGLIHLSDEYINDDIRPYSFTMCKFVFRNIYRMDAALTPKVTHFALGYKYDLWAGIPDRETYKLNMRKNNDQRKRYTWSFAGGVRDNRRTTLAAFATIEPNKVVIETGNSYNSPVTGLSSSDYRDLMIVSDFVLCPIGNISVDSFRTYEALECGAVPIVQDDGTGYWRSILNTSYDPPFVIGSIQETVAIVKDLLQDRDALEKKRQACSNFWSAYKLITANTLKNCIQTHLK